MEMLAVSARQALGRAACAPDQIDSIHFGITVPQHASFWGAPWVAAMIGLGRITGPTISQACATSARLIASAASEIEIRNEGVVLACACDRTSNGPHVYYPDSLGPGGRGRSEDWVWDNFGNDPHAKVSMVETAENVARSRSITRSQQDALALTRYEQYLNAISNDREFQRRYMLAPLEIPGNGENRSPITIDGDEGVRKTTKEGLADLKAVIPGGTVTFGTQTHPADGNAGVLVTSKARAREMAKAGPSIQILGYGESRAARAHMGQANVPAASNALNSAGLSISDIDVVKTHNPFVVNDIFFSIETGFDACKMNNYGSSLIFGHPQGPTGLRLVIEMIEELTIRGGGYGLFSGCAAGDSAAALVLKVG